MANGIADNTISEGQVAAFAMAVLFNSMDLEETAGWTRAMAGSGKSLHWDHDLFTGPLLDKHSTGGVGDKVSLILAPMLAVCGAYVPMISGYGLGHTGGTLDKLEAIPGLRTQFDTTQLQQMLQTSGCVIVGATERIAPADRRLYSIRDVTATIDSIPLITASILSKKLAAGLDGLVLDVKTGSGAFADTVDAARELARNLVDVGNQSGLRTSAVITDMNQVLGRSAGNGLEVMEAIQFLISEARDPRLQAVVFELGREVLLLGSLAANYSQAESMLHSCLNSGEAAECFQTMVAAQGGPPDLIDAFQTYLPKAAITKPAAAERSGIVQRIDLRAVGMIIVALGGGRRYPGDTIEPSVGLTQVVGIGDEVSVDQPLALVHAGSETDADLAIQLLRSAIELAGSACEPPPPVVERIT